MEDQLVDLMTQYLPVGVIVYGGDGRCRYVNAAAADLLSIPRERLLQENMLESHPGDGVDMLSAGLKTLDTGHPGSCEISTTNSTGACRHVAVRFVHPQLSSELALVAVLTDVTDQREAEQSLRFMQFSVDHATEMVAWVDPDCRIVYVNRAACDRLDYSESEFLSMSVDEVISGPSRESCRQSLLRVREKGSARFELTALSKNGDTFPVEVVAGYHRYAGQRYVVAFARDMSERRQAEQALEESEEHLRQVQKRETIGQLAAGIAHDFNNLLTAIIGYSDLILSGTNNGNGTAAATVHQDATEIKRTAERGAALVKQMLAFTRQQPLEPAALCANDIIVDMEILLRRLLGRSIQVELLLDPTVCDMEFDRSQLEQIVLNLAINARDAMPNGGRLTIQTANVTLTRESCRNKNHAAPGNHVLVSVSDTGCGIAKEVLPRIFDPFFTTKAARGGTGLGLSTVLGIVKQAGGTVLVDSEVGKGSVFEVYLPATRRSVHEDSALAGEIPQTAR